MKYLVGGLVFYIIDCLISGLKLLVKYILFFFKDYDLFFKGFSIISYSFGIFNKEAFIID